MYHIDQINYPAVAEFHESPVDQGGHEQPDYSYLADLPQPGSITADTLSEDYAVWGGVVPTLDAQEGNRLFVGAPGYVRNSDFLLANEARWPGRLTARPVATEHTPWHQRRTPGQVALRGATLPYPITVRPTVATYRSQYGAGRPVVTHAKDQAK
ncbi:MAG TPA: hypothetical protein VF809_00780 [Candidatus Saccharimonadales bacterium]